MAQWLTLEDRKILEEMYDRGESVNAIAEKVGRHYATIYHELKRGYTGEMDKNGRPGYKAEISQKRRYEMKMKQFQTAN